jgi:hypothetical protein
MTVASEKFVITYQAARCHDPDEYSINGVRAAQDSVCVLVKKIVKLRVSDEAGNVLAV